MLILECAKKLADQLKVNLGSLGSDPHTTLLRMTFLIFPEADLL